MTQTPFAVHDQSVPRPSTPPPSTLGDLFTTARQEPDVAEAALLGDLQLMQRALSDGGHRSVLCWQAQRDVPFVLRLGTVTLGLRDEPDTPLHERLGLLAADGSLRPVLQEELGLYTSEFVTHTDLVPVLMPDLTGETLRANALRFADWTRRASDARTAVQSARRALVTAASVCVLVSVMAFLWASALIAAGTLVILGGSLVPLAVKLRSKGTEALDAVYHCDLLRTELSLVLRQVPVGPAVLPGVPPVPEFNVHAG